jgi:hypothetical protein
MKDVVLISKLRVGKVWHLRGERVSLPEADADNLIAIGFAHEALPIVTTRELESVEDGDLEPVLNKGKYNRRDMRAKG